jgi:hypothetical protein
MAKTDLKKVQREAKKIRERHPNMSNAHVMKKAWSEARGGKVSGVKKKRTGKRKAVGKKRKAVGAKPRYYAREVHEVRRVGAISYTGGKVKISGTQVEETKKKLRHEIADQLSWLEVLKSQETTKRGKEQIQKHISEKRAELNRIK